MLTPEVRTEEAAEYTEPDIVEETKAEEANQEISRRKSRRDDSEDHDEIRPDDQVRNERDPAGQPTSTGPRSALPLRLQVPGDSTAEYSRKREHGQEDGDDTADQSVANDIR